MSALKQQTTRWEELVGEHTAVLNKYIAAIGSLPLDSWERPPTPEVWSPALVTTHLTLVYETLSQELTSGQGMKLRFAGWQRLLIRWRYLSHILKGGRFPTGVRAPRELRPEGITDRATSLARLRQSGEQFVQALTAAHQSGRTQLTHPYMGKLDTAQALRFCTVHVVEHQTELNEHIPALSSGTTRIAQ